MRNRGDAWAYLPTMAICSIWHARARNDIIRPLWSYHSREAGQGPGLWGTKILALIQITANFYKAIPDFFTTIMVNSPVESELSSVTEREILAISKKYLAELLILGLFYGRNSVFQRGANIIVPREPEL